MWAYYDRRVARRDPGTANVFRYFTGLGALADMDAINAEVSEVERGLAVLSPTSFLDVGVGPDGTFTRRLRGRGFALDQSLAALRSLRAELPSMPLVRADAMRLPLADKAVGRVLLSHLYGLLLPSERAAVIREASRVSDEMVILDSGRPPGAKSEHWQTRTLPDGGGYPIFRRHLDVETLLDEVGGEALFAGTYFVMIRKVFSRPL